MTAYQPYPSYRPSNVEWLGDLPEHWEQRRLKFIAPPVTDKVSKKPVDKLYLGLENVESGTGQLLLEAPTENVESIVTLFQVGDVLFGKLRPYLAKVVLAEFDGVCTGELLALRPIARFVENKFLFYTLLSHGFINVIDSMTYGAKMPRANPNQIGNMTISLPPLAEQRAIVVFLDREITHIDSLIAKKRELIDLLDKKRASIISHAVTKGLNPKARMKSSGVEWLGDVPEHWDVRRLKHLLRRGFTNGLFKKKEDFGNGTRLVNVSDIYQADFLIKINTLERVTATEQEVKVFSVQSGDIFFVRSSLKQEGVAASACMLEVPEPTVFESHVVRARPNSSLVIPKYLIYYLNSSLARQRLISLSETTTMTTVAQPKLSSLEVAFPSLAEQHDIVNLIDKRIFDIDELKKQITQSIDLLQKQRTALISAAVTGKIDVREQGN
jgi:type I restriction enzyme S subunit